MKAFRPTELKHPTAGTMAGMFDAPKHSLTNRESDVPRLVLGGFDIAFDTTSQPRTGDGTGADERETAVSPTLKVALIDCYRFSQEALVKAFESIDPQTSTLPFGSVQACIAAAPIGIDLVVYCAHARRDCAPAVKRDLEELRESMHAIPVIIMSNAEESDQPAFLRCVFQSGARGFIPARTTGIPMTMAIMAFVKAGGTYAPADVLYGEVHTSRAPEPAPESRFTLRQASVLALLKQGMANKTIAHELNMSESTVKVHVRNIMRAMGATNRTQAAFNAQQLTRGLDLAATL